MPDRTMEAGIEMSTVTDPRDRLHDEEDKDTETVITRDTGPQDIAVEGATVAVAALVEGSPALAKRIGVELENAYHIIGLEEIRVIRDRHTKVSRQLGFLRFHSINESRAFLEANHPYIYLYGPSAGDNDRSTRVRIAYSREREDRARVKAEGDWTCRMCAVVNFATRPKCFRCNAPRPEVAPTGPPGVPAPKVVNNGDNDAAPENQPSQFLLFRGLESSVSEELLAKGVAKLYRPSAGSNDIVSSNNPKKGAKVASTTGDSNLGAREGSIRRVLLVRDRKTNDSWRFGFAEFANVMDAQAAMTRLNSFEKFTISSRPVMVSYIHAGVFVPVMDPKPSTAHFTFSPLSNPSVKLMYWDDEGYVTELMLTSDEDDVGQDQPKSTKSGGQQHHEAKGTKESDKAKKRKADKVDVAASANAKKLAVPSHLQFWSNRHAELHGIPKASDENPVDGATEPSAPPAQSYADLNRNCCYLCMRQFKSSANVNRHERLSQLHREYLQNEEAKARGMAKLIKHGIIQQSSSEYRDRARERRQAFGRTKAGPRQKPAAPKDEEEPLVQTNSKGASLLSKMGWSVGSGLGAQGTGVTAPIATEVYAQGVGLGAQGGKLGDAVEEAGRNTRGRYDEFLEKTKETARQRYDQMNR
ncbi:uncharacterized protein N7482_009621 [Penicillium canariense]|uniref:Rna-binding protein n=1 Tax=Penicillium canariense TaxID=189055 RepID=A0A9W9LG07_9EURO|nr:uncharacterized protein N7482_009621 [Penicillium canariense]KAJ5153143.1 hypothetical protein N7482_009621 [Penicillium canariense]